MDKQEDPRKLLESLRSRALAILDAAESAGDHAGAIAAIAEVRALTEQLERTADPRAVQVLILDPRSGEALPLKDVLPPLGGKQGPT